MLDTLKKVFGFQEFRQYQEEIIKNIFNKKDVFVVMPTGGGKSLCYQLPAKIVDGTVVVISPLISLMKDQVDAARENGISAAFLNSSLMPQEMDEIYFKLRNQDLELLYIAPERFAMPNFIETLKTIRISLFAIDEAHCISEWGHDFRPDYLSLTNITKIFNDIPVAAFTATATQMVQSDIINKIKLRDPYIIRASFNRENLFYQVKRKMDVEIQILEFLKEHVNESGIIYCRTRDSVIKLVEFLTNNGITALPYHAGLPQEDRRRNQEAFNKDRVNIMVATIAFGMGIDKSNVRFVIHADLPKNIESYYQETGRSGRDGEPAICLLFFSRGDIPKIKYFIDQIDDDTEHSIALDKLNFMINYASHNVCRRKQLLEYFGENFPSDNCEACDICNGTIEKIDITTDAQIVMSAIARTQQCFGINYIVDIIVGADTKRIRELQHNKIKTYGTGKDKDKNHWRFITDELLAQEHIEQEGKQYPVLKIMEKGNNILFGEGNIDALKREEVKKKYQFEAGRKLEFYNETLFEKLRILRKKFAEEQKVPPYIIFSDRALHEMATYYPTTPVNMKKINGVADTKLERYGDCFINEIQLYLNENPDIPIPDTQSLSYSDIIPPKKIIGETCEKTYELYKKGHSIKQIVKERNLAPSTITSHLEKLIRDGRDIDINILIDPKKIDLIKEIYFTLKTWNTTPIVEYSNGKVNYEEARFVRAYLQREKNDFF